MDAKQYAALSKPFALDEISLLPKCTEKDKTKRTKKNCPECGGYHDFPSIHLSYIGHADITTRLNEADPGWTWEPMGVTPEGLPALDSTGALWAWLTIFGVRKPAYGDPGVTWEGKSKAGTPDGMKEAIGDMLRNGAMRFGVGTDLWSKSDKAKARLLQGGDDEPPAAPKAEPAESAPALTQEAVDALKTRWHALVATARENGREASVKAEFTGGRPNLNAFIAMNEAGRVEVELAAISSEVSQGQPDPASKDQLAKIAVLLKEVGLSDDGRKALLSERYQVESRTQLTGGRGGTAHDLIEHLGKMVIEGGTAAPATIGKDGVPF
ncbi:MAG: hypothetical protein U1E29_18370 [Coriobacteriia bacterium]|nr:hypothetical protein [Coriobacteriia bacterium]